MTSGTLLDAAAPTPTLPAAIIDNLRHPAVQRVADVLRSRAQKPRTILIDDEENIAQAIRAGVELIAVYASADRHDDARGAQASGAAPDLHVLSREVLRDLFASEKHSRMFALARAPKPASWRDLATAHGDLLVLDGVRIPGNIGAMLRSACAFGAAGVVLLDSGLTSIYDRRLIRASRGLLFTLPVLTATSPDLTGFLRDAQIPLVAMSAGAGEPLDAINRVTARLAILMGSERAGPSEELTDQATYGYAVPMTPGVESLNVSVAAGIVLYERHRESEELGGTVRRSSVTPQ